MNLQQSGGKSELCKLLIFIIIEKLYALRRDNVTQSLVYLRKSLKHESSLAAYYLQVMAKSGFDQ